MYHYKSTTLYSLSVIFFKITVILSGIIPFGIIPPPNKKSPPYEETCEM
jgi:hypothetical protein